jgi:hypothetical protein
VTPRSLDTNRAIALGESSGSPFRIANTGSSGAGSAAAAGFGGDAFRGDFFLAQPSSSLGVALLPDVLGRAACSSAAVIVMLDVCCVCVVCVYVCWGCFVMERVTITTIFYSLFWGAFLGSWGFWLAFSNQPSYFFFASLRRRLPLSLARARRVVSRCKVPPTNSHRRDVHVRLVMNRGGRRVRVIRL